MYIEVIKSPKQALFVSGKDKSRLIPGFTESTCAHGIYGRVVRRIKYKKQLKHKINLPVGTISHLHTITLTYGIMKKNKQRREFTV